MKKKARILIVGSLVMDLIVSTPRFPNAGETVLGTDYRTASGGKGANQAVQAALLGADVTMVGRVGEDAFGEEMIASLQQAGVHTKHLKRTAGVSSAIGNVQLEIAPDGTTQNRIIVVSGANMKITQEDVAFLEKEMDHFDMVILQFEIPMQINEWVADCAFRNNVPVMINTAPSAPASDYLLSRAAYVSPNEHEAQDMTGIPVLTAEDAQRASQVLLDRGVGHVIITRGAQGAVLTDRDGSIDSPCVPCEHVADPTAAGDSFIAAFCTALSLGADHESALRFANYTAHITVSRMGAQPSLPTLGEVLRLMEKDGKIGRAHV